MALRDNNYFVSDTNYGWGLDTADKGLIGDNTDIGDWWLWFRSPNSTSTSILCAEDGQNADYSRLATNSGGANTIVIFKSCFPIRLSKAIRMTPCC